MKAFAELHDHHYMARLRDILDVITRRRLVAIISLFLGLLVMALALKSVPKNYAATSRVLIVADTNGRDPSVTSIDLPAVATSTAVLSHVISDLHLPIQLARMKSNVKASVGARSSIMTITYRDTQPDRASTVANAVADQLSSYYETISTSRADSTIRKLDVDIAASKQRLVGIEQQISQESEKNPLVQSETAYAQLRADLMILVRSVALPKPP